MNISPKLLRLLALCAVLIFCIGMFFGYFEKTIQSWLGNEGGGVGMNGKGANTGVYTGVVQATDVPVTSDSPYVVASGSYPQFAQLPDFFNVAIREAVEVAKSEQEKSSRENWEMRFATDVDGLEIPDTAEVKNIADADSADNTQVAPIPKPDDRFQFIVKPTIMRNDDRYVAVVLRIAGYTGGAHGYQHIRTFTFDRTKQKILTIHDLYPGEKLKILAEQLRPRLVKMIAEKSEMQESEVDVGWIHDGTDPAKPENFAAFVPMSLSSRPGESVVVYFPEYQVAAYAMGEHEVVVPYSAE